MNDTDRLIPAIANALRDNDLLADTGATSWTSWDTYIEQAATVLALVRSWDASQGVVRVTANTIDNFGSEIAMLRQQLNEALNRISR